jgi:hypothetical protein
MSAKKKKKTLDTSHPEAATLIKLGITPARLSKLSEPTSHPASADPTEPTATPSGPAQYAADVLKDAGLPVTSDDDKMLETQMTEEGMPGGENNPLATDLPGPGSMAVPGNPDGVQEYPTLAEGAQEEADTLKGSNMASIYAALKSGDPTAQQYAAGLAGSQYEGDNPAANAAYANAFLKDAGQPEQAFPSGGGSTLGSEALASAMSSNPFSSLSGVIPSLGTQTANTSLQSALAGLSSGAAQQTLAANTSNAPGSPDQTPSVAQQTAVNPASLYQQILAQQLPGIVPGSAK